VRQIEWVAACSSPAMAPGLYLVQVKTSDGRVEMKRMVKEYERINFEI
jgi:hypothetical protein